MVLFRSPRRYIFVGPHWRESSANHWFSLC